MSDDADNIIGLYRRQAEAWARARRAEGRLFERGWLDRFCALVPPGGRVLDLGCGPGEPIAVHLASLGYAVAGVDSAPEMVALFRQAVPGGEGIVGDMRRLALGRRFDGVLAWDSFFHLTPDDQRAMFPVFAAHAEAGAPLMFTSGPSAGVAIGELGGEPLYHASLDPAEYRALLAENGFEVVAHVAEDATCGGRTVWLGRRIG